jgi:hypothetical protein
MPDLGSTMLDVVQFNIQLIGILFGTAELSDVIGQDIFHAELVLLV